MSLKPYHNLVNNSLSKLGYAERVEGQLGRVYVEEVISDLTTARNNLQSILNEIDKVIVVAENLR